LEIIIGGANAELLCQTEAVLKQFKERAYSKL